MEFSGGVGLDFRPKIRLWSYFALCVSFLLSSICDLVLLVCLTLLYYLESSCIFSFLTIDGNVKR